MPLETEPFVWVAVTTVTTMLPSLAYSALHDISARALPIPNGLKCCLQCGYPLTGLPTSTACPECGLPLPKGGFILLKKRGPGSIAASTALTAVIAVSGFVGGITAIMSAIFVFDRSTDIGTSSFCTMVAFIIPLLVFFVATTEAADARTGTALQDQFRTIRRVTNHAFLWSCGSGVALGGAAWLITPERSGEGVVAATAIALAVSVLVMSASLFAAVYRVKRALHRSIVNPAAA